MDFAALLATLTTIKGATFASMDCTTFPMPSVQKRTTDINVILFNSERSGYEQMVKRRLIEMGRNPDDFAAGPLPWGRRLYGPVIRSDKGDNYLQSIVLNPGLSEYFLRSTRGFDIPCRPEDLPGTIKRRLNQRLPLDRQVEVRTFNIDNIDHISVMGQVFEQQDQQTQQRM